MIKCNYNVHWDANSLATNMNKCLEYVNRLREYSLKSGSERDQLLLEKRESLQENVNKILINLKEEWRFVLTFVERFVTIGVESLERLTLPEDFEVFDMVLDFLYNVAGCIGVKRICRYWPTEVGWLTKLVGWLKDFVAQDQDTTRWTTLYTLVLWLSAAVRTPFGLDRFDVKSGTEKPLANQIIDLIQSTLTNYSLQPVLHRLAAGFYSRPDICRTVYLEQFVDSILSNLSEKVPSIEKVGHLRILATLLETVERTVLLEQSKMICRIAMKMFSMVDSNHELLTKLAIKILGRSALIDIPPRLVRWRYNCGKRIIALDQKPSVEDVKLNEASKVDDAGGDIGDIEDDFEVQLPDYFEQLVQVLITNINHQSTVVRYSVSKYMATVCSRLPYRFSEQILHHICHELCTSTQDDLAWHGACLTLAEFVRRGFVPVPFLPTVISVVERALFYEHIKGSFSLGAHVRDSAAYICWSMARAYDARLIGPFVQQLAPLLICVACFDRELNCRRAASAVIQELAGRTQLFPHWLEVIACTEFHQLSLPRNTFLDIGVQLASFDLFRPPIVHHLVSKKINHWDASIRRLAAETLGKLAKVVRFSESDSSTVDKLCLLTSDPELNSRHGAILTLGHLILNEPGLLSTRPTLLPVVRSLVDQLESNHLFNGIGGDYMREATLSLIGHFAQLNSTLEKNNGSEFREITTTTLESSKWNQFIVDSFQSTKSIETEFVRDQLVRTCRSMLCSCCSKVSVELTESLTLLIHSSSSAHSIKLVSDSIQLLEPEQCQLLGQHFHRILTGFHKFIEKNFPLGTTRNSESIASVVGTIILITQFYYDQLSEVQRLAVFDLLVLSLDDHTINNKGDTGQCVRIASIEAMQLRPDYRRRLNRDQFFRIFQLIAAEALFGRNRSFALASETLEQLAREMLTRAEFDQLIDPKYLNQLSQLTDVILDIPDDDDQTLIKYQHCVQLLSCPSMTNDILPGIVCVLSDPIMESYSKLIVDYLRNCSDADRTGIFDRFLEFFTIKSKCQRLSIPCLVAARRLLLEISSTAEYRLRLVEVTWHACQSSANPKKYIHACDIFCALIPLDPGQLARTTFPYLFVFLGHRLPRIRSYTAMELYTALLAIDFDDQDNQQQSDSLMELFTLLQDTDWLQMDLAKKARIQVRTLIKSLDSCLSNNNETTA